MFRHLPGVFKQLTPSQAPVMLFAVIPWQLCG